MKDNVIIQRESKGCSGETLRKPGRPTVISASLRAIVIDLYRKGHGYRSIATILASEYDLLADYSSVRRALLRLGAIRKSRLQVSLDH